MELKVAFKSSHAPPRNEVWWHRLCKKLAMKYCKVDDPLNSFRNQSKGKCVFCAPDLRLKVIETENFNVLLDPFPLVEGHFMISSKLHFGCAGEIDSELFGELKFLKNKLGAIIRKTLGTVSFYEHGRAGSCLPRDGANQESYICHHFHIHALPSPVDVHATLAARYPTVKIGGIDSIPDLFSRKGNYIFSENASGEALYCGVENLEVPSHLMRTLISQAMGEPSRANWESYVDINLFSNAQNFANELSVL